MDTRKKYFAAAVCLALLAPTFADAHARAHEGGGWQNFKYNVKSAAFGIGHGVKHVAFGIGHAFRDAAHKIRDDVKGSHHGQGAHRSDA